LQFSEKLAQIQTDRKSVLCVGLDPDLSRLPKHYSGKDPLESVLDFCTRIVDATLDYACAYKPNLAFFEALGVGGLEVLKSVTEHIDGRALTIADGKRGDIGNTAKKYAHSFFEEYNFDSCTVSAYMGRDSVDPFLDYPGKLVFVLVKTSNEGSGDFQDLIVNEEALYQHVARKVEEWGDVAAGEVGFVVGATQGDTLSELRTRHPNIPFLVPGIGAQGGSIENTMAAHAEKGRVIVNSSRSIIFASDEEDFAKSAGLAAQKLAKLLI